MAFVILCFPRTASTLLISALGTHPLIRQGMEIFNPELEGDAPYVPWRKAALLDLYGPQSSYLNPMGYLDGQRFDLTRLSKRFFDDFDGTKIMYDQLDRNSGVWDQLTAMPGLRVIVMRRNFIDAAVSFKVALDTNIWHVAAADAPHAPPPMTVEPGYFSWFYDHFCAGEADITRRFNRSSIIELDYDSLISNWQAEMTAVFNHLGLAPIDCAMPFRKGLRVPAASLIANRSEIREHYARHPVLSRHVESAMRSLETCSAERVP